MVKSRGGLLRQVGRAVCADCGRLVERVRSLAGPPRLPDGIRAYLQEGPGGRRWVHLRFNRDGGALLFLDAVQAIYLSPLHAQIIRLLLEDYTPEQVTSRLGPDLPHPSPRELKAEVKRAEALLEVARTPGAAVHPCELGFPQPPAFALRPEAPFKADLALTYACQNRCSHCYNEPGRRALPELDTQTWTGLLQRLWEIGIPYVIFTGGEPTLRPDLVELVRAAHHQGQATGLNTNGRRLAQPGYAAELAEAGLDNVQVTLNSTEAEVHNRIVGAEAFAETVAGLRQALGSGLHVLTNTTLSRVNAAEVETLVDFLAGLGIKTFAMNGMIHSGCGRAHPQALGVADLQPVLERVRDLAADRGLRFLWYTPTEYCRLDPTELGLGVRCCNAAEYSLCIEPNGDVLPCQSYYQPAGNLLCDPWEAVWESRLFRALRYRREEPGAGGLPERCHECENLMLCAGGCPLERSLTAAPQEVPAE